MKLIAGDQPHKLSLNFCSRRFAGKQLLCLFDPFFAHYSPLTAYSDVELATLSDVQLVAWCSSPQLLLNIGPIPAIS